MPLINQFQLDIFGEVANTLYQCREAGLEPSPEDGGEDVAQAMIEFLETGWERPDDGIWEVRGPRRHFVHSKMMAWVAVDRAVKSVEKGWFTGISHDGKRFEMRSTSRFANKALIRA